MDRSSETGESSLLSKTPSKRMSNSKPPLVNSRSRASENAFSHGAVYSVSTHRGKLASERRSASNSLLFAFGNIPFLPGKVETIPPSSPPKVSMPSKYENKRHIHEIFTPALACHVAQFACASSIARRCKSGRFALFLTRDGDVYKAGEKLVESAELEEHVKRPPLLVRTLVRERALRGKVVKMVACGPAHAAAVTRCGELLCWGNASDGKLGHGDRRKAAAEFPQRVVDLSGVRICAVACGAAHTVALTTQGKLYSWGRGANGRLGHGNSRTLWKPKLVDYFTEKGGWRRGLKSRTAGLGRKPVSESRPIVELAKGISRRFSLHSASGQREDSARGPTIAHVYAGLAFTMAISVDGNAYCFGAGEEGQCATPIATDALFPALVNTLAQHVWTSTS